ncbi:Spermatogenesis-associated protein 1 like protein [Argiope bruennichi]|uniref:Spermatogenesis-associated protein 1 like protein n=1 Tax=Argiope bruennichi TaxID=94029 RepID=A0A8T0EH67_ARGBR|nr:Spermatogenesis-associated protein 1 like protein [Argiope bruennichi]
MGVIPSTTLLELRSEIREQLGTENVPDAYVFLRSVGRNFTQVKSKQELELKVKSFLPPYAEEPEIYVKEGEYTAVRSASVGVLSRTTKLTSSASTPVTSSSESQTDSLDDPAFSGNLKRRALSLDRRQNRPPMTSVKAVSSQQVPQSRSQRTGRPPTPRVKERFFIKTNKFRSSSIASKMNESIRESPTEQVEEIRTPIENLKVETDSEMVLNSPPPRPSSETSKLNSSDIKIPVPTPTPTPTPQDPGKNDAETPGPQNNNESHSLTDNKTSEDEDTSSCPNTEPTQADKSDLEEINHQEPELTINNESPATEEDTVPEKEDEIHESPEDKETEPLLEDRLRKDSSELMFDDRMQSKMGDEDVIVDPIKLLQGEGDSMKNGDENGRDHYDEGFHSGELVASEEDSNSIDTLGSSRVKDVEELSKPAIRAATPMPRSTSFYKVNLDPEIRQLQSKFEELRAERRLRELKRDALMQKVRDLQKRKATSKDRAREEWKRRYQDVKKATPRLEDHCSKLRQELEKLVKDMLVSIKTDRDSQPHKPSKKTSYKIMIMRLLQEVEDLRRRLQSVTIRLNAETKLRAQAEFEVKKLRQDLLHKKTQVTLTRKQTAFPQTSEQFFISAV